MKINHLYKSSRPAYFVLGEAKPTAGSENRCVDVAAERAETRTIMFSHSASILLVLFMV